MAPCARLNRVRHVLRRSQGSSSTHSCNQTRHGDLGFLHFSTGPPGELLGNPIPVPAAQGNEDVGRHVGPAKALRVTHQADQFVFVLDQEDWAAGIARLTDVGMAAIEIRVALDGHQDG